MSTTQFLWDTLPNLLVGFPGQRPGGLVLSVLLAAVSTGIGLVLGLVVGLAETSRWRAVRRIAAIYVEVFRGIPLLLLLLLIHQVIGGKNFGLHFSPLTSTILALTLSASAYYAEITRAGLLAIPQESVDAARLLGANRWQVLARVRLPFALRVMLPAFANETITLFKDSSVVVVLGVGELMTVAHAVLGSNVRNSVYWVPVYLTVGGLYALVALVLSRLASRWELRHPLANRINNLAFSQ